MPTYDQTPATLNITFNRANDLSALVDADIDMTGYTVTAELFSLVSGLVVTPLTVSFVSQAQGQVNVSLSDTASALLPNGTYGWRMVWVSGSVTRTAIVGMVEVI